MKMPQHLVASLKMKKAEPYGAAFASQVRGFREFFYWRPATTYNDLPRYVQENVDADICQYHQASETECKLSYQGIGLQIGI
ncbi:MAG: hypothetical protein KJP23_11340 [Deltaproteobacteria bacterium]|nr:hypothetical protein [Deltaproteobacteria bacterium]